MALQELADREQPLVDAWYFDGFAPSHNASHVDCPATTGGCSAESPRSQSRHVYSRRAGAPQPDGRRIPGRKGSRLRSQTGMPARQTRETAEHPLQAAISHPGTFPLRHLVDPHMFWWWAADWPVVMRRQPWPGVVSQSPCWNRAHWPQQAPANDQGILYTRLSRRHSALVDFALQSFQFASTFYREMLQAGTLIAQVDGELCGSFQQSDSATDMATLGAALVGLEELAQVLDAACASDRLGIDQPSAGYWYPRSGWLSPSAVCQSPA